MIMIISTMVLSNVAIVREKEMGTFEMLISAPVSRSEVIYGKTIPYVLLGMSNLPLILGVAIFAFHVPMRGSLLALLIAAFAFVCTAVALGTLISTYCRNQQQATLAGFLFIFPMIMFSGLLFPLENMPDSLRWLFLRPARALHGPSPQHHAQRRGSGLCSGPHRVSGHHSSGKRRCQLPAVPYDAGVVRTRGVL
jgi:ABC-type multidrug transport system permease subunit